MTDTANTHRAYEIERRAQAMSRADKIDFLHRRGWYKWNNRWRHALSDTDLPFGAAAREQIRRDLAGEW